MNWLETVFGLSPDGGNGTTEFLVMVAIALALATILAGRTRAVRARRAERKHS
jgi:hypothetical protein